MQILARAFGPSKIISNPKGWEVGSTELKLTEGGKEILNPDDESKKDFIRLQQIHQDCVAEMPSQFELLASSDITPIQALAKYYDDGKARGFTNAPDVVPDGKHGQVQIIGCVRFFEWYRFDIFLVYKATLNGRVALYCH